MMAELDVRDDRTNLIEVLDWLDELGEEDGKRKHVIINLSDGRSIGIYRADVPEVLRGQVGEVN